MAFISIPHVAIKGIATCVPKDKEKTLDCSIEGFEADKFIASVGVCEKRIANADTCTSDLCQEAAEKRIEALSWNKERYLETDKIVYH